jgi:OOP family OmpA-OmpF porin
MRRGALVLLVTLTGCTSAGRLRETQAVLRSEIEKARRSGAEQCAPKELALAEANVDFATTEIDLGNGGRAEDHLQVAEDKVRRALDLSKDCKVAAKQRVIIEKVDRDGDGVPDVEDQCPDVPGPPENHGCPVTKDTDGDGIPDDIDRCPLEPEDKDGFQDEDGCPDPDNDNDGIVDAMDACPNNPGPLENHGCPILDREGVPDSEDECPDVPGPKENQGCPKYALVQVRQDRIELRQQVHFATRRHQVLPDSFRLLTQVVQVLKDVPQMRVRIEGHTDSIGGEIPNEKLSQKRAEAVMAYLVSKGIAPARLEAVGYGSTRPVASNKTEKGRSRNRRTEFHIISVGEQGPTRPAPRAPPRPW